VDLLTTLNFYREKPAARSHLDDIYIWNKSPFSSQNDEIRTCRDVHWFRTKTCKVPANLTFKTSSRRDKTYDTAPASFLDGSCRRSHSQGPVQDTCRYDVLISLARTPVHLKRKFILTTRNTGTIEWYIAQNAEILSRTRSRRPIRRTKTRTCCRTSFVQEISIGR
jgi:hypothetical protein